jgi:hypothetical protein
MALDGVVDPVASAAGTASVMKVTPPSVTPVCPAGQW